MDFLPAPKNEDLSQALGAGAAGKGAPLWETLDSMVLTLKFSILIYLKNIPTLSKFYETKLICLSIFGCIRVKPKK